MTEGRIRLTILGGYLGSGKTTWLRHQLHVGRFGHVHVLVNEAAETGVDDVLLAAAARLTLLAGGCCCCTGQAALIAALRTLCDERSRAQSTPRLEQIVLEASGLADPGAIVAAIQNDPVLVNHILVEQVLVMVDALHGLAQLQTEPLGRRQIGAADSLILTKTDGASPDQLAILAATLRQLNPTAPQSGAVLGVVAELPDPGQATAPPLPPLTDEDNRGPILPTRLTLDPAVDWSAFTLWLSALLHARGHDLVRVKGVVRTPAGRLLLQTVRRVVQSPEILPDMGDTQQDGTIVLIGRGFQPADLQRSLSRFVGHTVRPPAQG